ncbi:hypothetical protein GGR53DRAFT_512995 [Hypoxylon sp. FL1150]|nr:hypothetical protein GGR53DRAFT_512995 [Hypoxylon sp. FL1150]
MGEYHSSQTPGNLVFGTSEANSVMTRHEMAWQRLIQAEQEIMDCNRAWGDSNMDNPSASLQMALNEPNKKIWYDFKDDSGRYYQKWMILPRETYERIDADPLNIDVNSPIITQVPGDTGTTIDQMVLLTHWYPFLAYSIRYQISLDTFSYILREERAESLVRFFPFQRSWFHKAESNLDDAVFKELERAAWDEMESKGPLMTDSIKARMKLDKEQRQNIDVNAEGTLKRRAEALLHDEDKNTTDRYSRKQQPDKIPNPRNREKIERKLKEKQDKENARDDDGDINMVFGDEPSDEDESGDDNNDEDEFI